LLRAIAAPQFHFYKKPKGQKKTPTRRVPRMTVKHFAIIGLSFALSVAPRLSAGVNFVQVNYKTSNSAASLAVPYPSAQTAGNLNIVVVGWNDSTSAVSSVTDSKGNTYLRAIGPTAGTKLTQSIYYAKNIVAGSNTVSVTFNTAVLFPDVRVLEYSGADKANPLDATAAAAGTSLTTNSGPASTTSLNELIFGAGITFNAYYPGSGFTQRVLTNFGDIAEDATVASMGTYSFSAPLHLSAPWVTQMATFRAQGASTPAFTVSGISPSSGTASGGTSVKIAGTGFLSGATVTFGGAAGTNVAVPDGNTITVTTPSHAAGTVNVVVTNGIGQSGTLTNAYTYTSAPPTGGGGGGAIHFVQVKSATPHPTSLSVAVTYSVAQTAGNLNVVEVGWNDTTSSVNSVTDSRGNGYVLAVGPTRGTGLTQSIYYAKNIVGGTNSVAVTFNKAAAVVDVRALEYSGLDTANPLDVTAAAAGTGTTGNSGAATTRSANELIVGAGMTAGAFTKAGTGFTSRIITSPDADIAEDQITTTPGSYSATAPTSSSTPWVMQMAAFQTSTPVSPTKHSVSISWDPSPSSDVAYYKVYRGTVAGGPYNLVATNLTTDTYTDSTVQSGTTYYYVTTTVSSGGQESIFSNQFKCTIPTP
jgi:IPT/TIG domain